MGTSTAGLGDDDGGTSLPDRLAVDYIARVGAGEELDLESFVAQLSVPADRERLRTLVAEAQRIQGLLPSQVRVGLVLKGRYRLLAEIGSGGMGKVFKALDLELQREVAVKVLAALGVEAFDPQQIFIKEARVLAGLQHPNIVAVHEVATEGDITFLVMDLVHGTPVSDVLSRVASALRARGGAPPRQAWLMRQAIEPAAPGARGSLIDCDSWFEASARIMVEVARAVDVAHEQGVIHRDLKPHNIRLRGDGSPVVLDFGLAGRLTSGEHGSITRGLFGTIGYVAPEQARSKAIGADRRTDVYQLGLLLYEFLCLQRAFTGDEIAAVLDRIDRGDFRRPRALDRGVPFELEAICLKAMELNPAARYATAGEMAEDLRRYVDGSAVPLAARGGQLAAGVRTGRYWLRRNKFAAGLAAVVLVAGAAVPLLADQLSTETVLPAEPVPAVQSFAWSRLTKEKTVNPAEVHVGDVLGVTLDAARPQYVYALSAFGGTRTKPAWVAPMLVGFPKEDPREPPDRSTAVPGSWSLLVPPGGAVTCTQINDTSPIGSIEGMWIFTSNDLQPEIDNWMSELWDRSDGGKTRVSFEEAQKSYDILRTSLAQDGRSPTRGDPVVLSEIESQQLNESLMTAKSIVGLDEWTVNDPRRTAFYFPVEP